MKTLLYIGNKLSKHGYTPTSIETLGLFFEKEGYTMLYASEKENQLMRFLDMGWSVFKNRNKADYIIIDTYSTFSFWYAFMVSQLCRLFGLKYIPILRGGNLTHRLDKNPRLCQMVFNHSYKNVAPSGYLLDAFQKRNYPNLVFIPNTIEVENYPFLNREIKTPKLLWVRSFAWLYNPKMAVDVLKELQKKYPDAKLCMVGPDKDGSLETTRQYAKEQSVEVKFTGRLSKPEWIKLSEEYNVFINTTNFDNTPVSVIEALCLGLPVVTTNVGGIPFLLKNQQNALLVNKEDTDAMVAAIETLINNPESKDSIVKNALDLAKTFDWNVVKEQWRKLLN
ncbi:MAG: glycosyltransferase family 4 protein [Flavobacteriaceae bacterium]